MPDYVLMPRQERMPELETEELDTYDLNNFSQVLESADLTPEEHAYLALQSDDPQAPRL